MSPNESVADVFLMALKSMPKDQKDAVIAKIAQDEEFNHDLQDLLIFEERKHEKSRPFGDYLAEKGIER
ncbi:hypothetical protein K8I31_11370 [bacterium]|nr:hypothetical protein [bacterium]